MGIAPIFIYMVHADCWYSKSLTDVYMFTISLALVIKSLLVGSCELTSIHAGILADSTRENYVSNTIYDNTNPDQIEMLPDTQIHRDVKLDLAGYSFIPLSHSAIMPPLVESHKCASPFESSITTPPTKQAWQLPSDWHKNGTLSKPSLSCQSVGVTYKKPTYKIPTPASVKKIVSIFLSQEQTQILKLVQDGNRHWQRWYANYYFLKTVLKKWLHSYWKVC